MGGPLLLFSFSSFYCVIIAQPILLFFLPLLLVLLTERGKERAAPLKWSQEKDLGVESFACVFGYDDDDGEMGEELG